jgi:hypothetical protein
LGRGTYYRSSKDTTSSYRRLDVRYLQRHGLLERGTSSAVRWFQSGEETARIDVRSDGECVWLSYRHRRHGDEDWQSKKYPVRVEWTPCNYGGSRPWFRCPAVGCVRRVAVLYGGDIFACRHCHELNYQSQHEQAWDRALSRYQCIRVKLGGEPGCVHPFPGKPKGMHWRTYEGWCIKANQAESVSWPNWIYKLIPMKA